MDWSVGRVLDALREQGLAERTLVFFTSDNGGTQRAVNAPLRGFKGSTLEGGMRVPAIAWWPGKIPSGTVCDAVTGMFDILPTFAALAGGQVPSDRKIDGANIWPQLSSDKQVPAAHETFYYYRGFRLEAVRHGDWKLQLPSEKKPSEKPALYNLRTDMGEAIDVAAANPAIITQLQALAVAMKDDLGLDGPASGSRELGKADNAQPLMDHDGKVRPGFDPSL